jgi:hypothetical protein
MAAVDTAAAGGLQASVRKLHEYCIYLMKM